MTAMPVSSSTRSGHRAVLRLALVLIPAGMLAMTVGPAGAQSRATAERQAREALPSLVTEVDLERRMLEEDLAAYAQARVDERNARDRAESLAQRLDTALTAPTPDLAVLDRLGGELAGADLVRELAEDRVGNLRGAIRDRLRRLRLIESDLEVLARAAPLINHPLNGVWRVTTEPGRRRGTLDMDVDGTVISGLYEIDGFGGGSLRGSYAGLAVRLELHDAQQGLRAVFTGHYDPAGGGTGDGGGDSAALTGLWQPTELGLGQAGSGTWLARKVPPADDDPLRTEIQTEFDDDLDVTN